MNPNDKQNKQDTNFRHQNGVDENVVHTKKKNSQKLRAFGSAFVCVAVCVCLHFSANWIAGVLIGISISITVSFIPVYCVCELFSSFASNIWHWVETGY